MKSFIVIGVIAMALGVVLGAFGAHGLKARLEPSLLAAYQTGVEYHLYHGLGLILVGVLGFHFPGAAGLQWGGWLLLAGMLLFSGSLYLMAISGVRWLGAITPFGGMAFIVGWCWIAWSLIKSP
ncbi:MAG: DUF423 domain-containing protein [Pseudomonadales bacterium]|jgi:uncharacterized membrane protein YgdD (TMEM256/DUF423 family)|uniref:DUF423 domain-containing protein n=1 Tax=unclassified Ketobacter TaxID=2639109 RepID=UPI000C8A7C81|nr:MULTISPECIES: DUF423 domain-containing protein [unclassified Ketobacter]MAQ26840.1 DUF423 domain-containing protein [Pseudomonadales bacterium]MEC8810163.1 DUF423 domain-containing protein [Pseudomonadota bacterium]TNC89990.1 MAG: DUF423 domain-containing protein [Alcanivorax sp.]HAG95124.1 DUF423 domain-containing protein [Gammaproteobacteria bacterium]MCK5792618.1 DUF423 domain-containing protein [Ketobacter sp.]|tara:strand:+ start:1589 stop:1960 length:372 start_codon:yes stop_codon:yes gene_type:complete